MTDFKDHFSLQSDDYAKYRPSYPNHLFETIIKEVSQFDLVWDCATGNGQAAKALAPHFKKVIATDASEKQIQKANPIQGVEFQVTPAEQTPFDHNSFDLITVAQAAHWFDLPRFYQEVERVLKPGGTLAMWTYEFLTTVPHINDLLQKFYFEIVYDFWPPERRLVETGYRDLYFPYERIVISPVTMYLDWNYQQVIGYFNTWSAVKNYRLEKKEDPVSLIAGELLTQWGDPEKTYRMDWNLPLLMARIG